MGAMHNAAAALTVAAGSITALGQVSGFVILPPADGNYVRPLGISGDGTTVFGQGGTLGAGNVEAYRWTARSGGQLIGLLVSGSFSQAFCSDLTGTHVYGEGGNGSAFAWSAPLPGSISTPPGGAVLDVSADGAVRLTRTERYTGGSGTAVPSLPGDQEPRCASISADGSAVALTSHFFQPGGSGYGYGGGTPEIVRDQACRWSASTGTVGCGFLQGTDRSFATSISEDGTVVVGTCKAGNGLPRGFRWTTSGGMSELLPATGQATPTSVQPVDCTADGSAVACITDGEACVWTATGGFTPIKQVLVANGWDVGAWTFYDVAGISDDGTVVTGMAVDGDGQSHAWAAPLTQSCSGPANPWIAARRVIVAGGDPLPGGGTAGAVSDVAVNGAGAALLRIGSDLWVAPAGGGQLMPALSATSGDGMGIEGASMNDAGVIAAARLSTVSVGAPPANEVARTVMVGPPGAMLAVAANDDAAPADGGGGSLRTYDGFGGPLMSNGGLAVFQTGIDGGTAGQVRCLAHNTLTGGPLVRSAPAVSINSPQLRAVSDGGVVVRTAGEGLLAGGPPPIVEGLIAPTGGAAPGVAGGTYSSFSSVCVNGAGVVAFAALVSTGSGVREAVYTCAPGGTPQLALIDGAAIGGSAVSGVTGVQIGSSGSLYVTAALSDGRAAVLKVKPSGAVVLAAADGDLAPGAGPCRSLSGWSLLGVDGRRVLLATAASGPSGSSQTLATWGEEEGLSVIVRTGEAITLRPGVTGTIAGAGPAVLGGNGQDGRPHAMRGGHLVYTATVATSGGAVSAVIGQELPPLACGSADVGSQGGTPGADGVLNNNDFVAFIDLFFSARPAADMGVQGGVAGQDGHWDNNDFVVFIDSFFAGCV